MFFAKKEGGEDVNRGFKDVRPRDMKKNRSARKALIIYYSFSGQTCGIVKRFADGLESEDIQVTVERLHPADRLRFPLTGYCSVFWMMLTTFLRFRVPIKKLSAKCAKGHDLLVLAGPTWSYNPSGPVLSFLDAEGPSLFQGRQVLAIISCRGYWRVHWLSLKRTLRQCGAIVSGRAIFTHPTREPWRTLGVFYKIAGKSPERSRFIGKFYPRYGHSKRQFEEAFTLGAEVGRLLATGGDISVNAVYDGNR